MLAPPSAPSRHGFIMRVIEEKEFTPALTFTSKNRRDGKNNLKLVRGFTLLEILVVIAIIGILSAVVIGLLNSAKAKGANSAIKADLHGLISQSNLIYDNANPNSYAEVCNDKKVVNAIKDALNAGKDTGTVATRCNSIDTEWAADALLRAPEGTNVYWCVDSAGGAKGEANELAGATVCA